MNWVLILFLVSPGGDFIDKRAVYYATQDQCERALKASSKPQFFDPNLYGIMIQGKVCVTKAQWETGYEPNPRLRKPLD